MHTAARNENNFKSIMPHCNMKYNALWIMSYEWAICAFDNLEIRPGDSASIWQKHES